MLKNPTQGNATSGVPQPNRNQIPRTAISQLPRLPERRTFALPGLPSLKSPVAIMCAGCGGRLDLGDNFQQSIHSCRKCIGIYARIDAQIEESAKRKKKELLERFFGEVQR